VGDPRWKKKGWSGWIREKKKRWEAEERSKKKKKGGLQTEAFAKKKRRSLQGEGFAGKKFCGSIIKGNKVVMWDRGGERHLGGGGKNQCSKRLFFLEKKNRKGLGTMELAGRKKKLEKKRKG